MIGAAERNQRSSMFRLIAVGGPCVIALLAVPHVVGP